MDKGVGNSTEDLIRAGVANHVSVQRQNPAAISDGVDIRKAFDTDTPSLNSVKPQTDHLRVPPESVTSLAISKNDKMPNTDHCLVESGQEAEPDPQSSAASSHPNIEVIFPDGSKLDDEVQEPKGEDSAKEDKDDGGAEVGLAQKKKKKRKPKSQRGLNAPTGFEEYYVDPPITPEQHEEEIGLYDISHPFAQRIETAIQRYFAKRNLDSDRKNLFDKYLTYGGIAGGPKMFSGGLDAKTIANSNSAEIATLTATHAVAFDQSDPRSEMYVVDFEGCLRGFLSSNMPGSFEVASEDRIKNYTGVIRNFLNYLLHHDVCPEYRDQIEASRRLCDQAQRELWQIAQTQSLLPGAFNMACSEIFGGIFRGIHNVVGEEWMSERDKKEMTVGISPEHARQVFKIGFAAHATNEQITKYKAEMGDQRFQIISTEDLSFEVTGTTLGSSMPDTQALYSHDQAKGLSILGKLHVKTWHNPGTADEDLTEEEEAELVANPPATKKFEFWLEDEILEHIFVGMKFHATVKELSFGTYFFDAVHGVHCSFLTVLPNQLMIGWREVEKEWLLPRPTEDGEEQQDDGKNGDTEATVIPAPEQEEGS